MSRKLNICEKGNILFFRVNFLERNFVSEFFSIFEFDNIVNYILSIFSSLNSPSFLFTKKV